MSSDAVKTSETAVAPLPPTHAHMNDDVRAFVKLSASDLGTVVPVWLLRAGYSLGIRMHSARMDTRGYVTKDVRIPAAEGTHTLTLRFFIPTHTAAGVATSPSSSKKLGAGHAGLKPRPDMASKPLRGLMMFIHGGGFTIGDLRTHESTCVLLCTHARVVVVSVEYRLAPEARWPAQLDDCMVAYRWICAHAGAHLTGLEFAAPLNERICVCGDSAGGFLTLHIASQVLQHNSAFPAASLPLPAVLAPIYPLTDVHGAFPSRMKYSRGYELTAGLIAAFNQYWLGPRVGDKKLYDEISPLQFRNLAAMPPTLLLTAECDPLHDEGIAMVDALRAAGAKVEHMEASGLIHGFINMFGTIPSGRPVLTAFADRIAEMLDHLPQ